MLRPSFAQHITAIRVSAFLCLLTAASSATAQSTADRTFQAWDKDKSGALSREELPENARRNFDKADTDGDGQITPTEHAAYLQQRRPQSAQPRVSDSVDIKRNIAYADNTNPRQMLDLLLPKARKTEEPLPVIAFIHGGGWRNGNKNSGIGRVLPFVHSGSFVGATIGYRLSGEAQWPSQIHDCKAAIRWLKAHAKDYNFDPNRICVFGTSAGGHLVAMLGVTGDVEELEGDLGSHGDQSSRIAAVIDFFGPTNFLTMNDFPGKMNHDAPDSPESLLIGAPIQQNQDQALAACPMKYITSDDAPILIMHGTKDPLVPFDQSVQFHKALKAAKVDATLIEVTNGGHGFGGKDVTERVRQFVDRVLLGHEVTVSTEPIETGK